MLSDWANHGWTRCATPLLVCVMSIAVWGCKRIPTRALPTASVTPATTPIVRPSKTIEEAVRIEPIDKLCERTCEHWLSLRFPQPVGYGNVQDLVNEEAHTFLERQRKHNRSRCQSLCVSSADRKRAQCVLTSTTAERANRCAEPQKPGSTNAIAEGHSSFKTAKPKHHGLHKRYIGSSKALGSTPPPRSPRHNPRKSQTVRFATGYAPH